jgi:hypothetical protein
MNVEVKPVFCYNETACKNPHRSSAVARRISCFSFQIKKSKDEILYYVQNDKKVNLQKFWKTLLEGIDEYEV